MEKQNNKTEKLTDKAFSRLLFTSVLGIVVCIVCLCSGTYAWFSETLPSQGNEIKSADECLLEVSVTKGDGSAVEDIENGAQLDAGESYTVTLKLPANTASGYCQIKAGGEIYYSDYIVRHNGETQIKTFVLKVQETQTVTFTTRWGIYAKESDVIDGEMMIP